MYLSREIRIVHTLRRKKFNFFLNPCYCYASHTCDRAAVFCGKRFQTKELHHPHYTDFYIQGNLYAGLLHGYGDRFPNIAGVTLAGLPTAGLGYKKTVLEMLYMPTFKGGVFTSFLT